MKLLRDRNIFLLFRRMIFVMLLFLLLFYLYPSMWLIPLLVFFLMVLVWVYLKQRTRDVERLTLYLKQLNNQNFNYDMSEFSEGELSLLYSEVFKTTVTLKTTNEEVVKQHNFLNRSIEDISHQLKTPITALSLLNDLQMDSGDWELLEKSRIQLDRMEWLVVSLLKLTQLETSVIIMKPIQMRSSLLIEEALMMVEPIINARAIDFVISGDESILTCDLNWTKEAIFNVINNKLSYAQSKIYIEVRDVRLYTEIRVWDDGRAIMESKRIFERFYRGDSDDSRGVGIGLSLSQAIVEYQGGKLYVEGENTFVFTLYKS